MDDGGHRLVRAAGDRPQPRAQTADDETTSKSPFKVKPSPHKTGGGGGGSGSDHPATEDIDEDGRPVQKLLLVAGPPGLGKTTMAHVLARHAGFEVVEINASDERTATSLKQRVENATQMRHVMHRPGQVSKPNCLILDEIDGALEGNDGKGAISELIKLALAAGKAAGKRKLADEVDGEDFGEQEEQASSPQRSKKTKGGGSTKLNRPIICICNDLWAPALKPLRDVACIYQFISPSPRTVATRLTEICKREGMRPERDALAQLAELVDGDIRSALNTLQFMQRKYGRISKDTLAIAAIGHKDVGKSNFELWTQIFSTPRVVKGLGVSTTGAGGSKVDLAVEYFKQLRLTIDGHGDAVGLLAGCHSNYLTATPRWSTHDMAMTKTLELSEWLSYADKVRNQNFLTPAVLAFHRYCKDDGSKPKLSAPIEAGQSYRGAIANGNLVQTFIDGVVGAEKPSGDSGLGVGMTVHSAVLDFLPSFLKIIDPAAAIKSASLQLLAAPEKERLKWLVGLMLGYGMSYHARFIPEVGETLELSPPLHTVVSYTIRPAASAREEQDFNWDGSAKQLNTFTRASLEMIQLVQREATIQSLRSKAAATAIAAAATPPGPALAVPNGPLSAASPTVHIPVSKDAAPATFGRGSAAHEFTKAGYTSDSAAAGAGTSVAVRYKHHAGFTNAVRRPVKLMQLL